MKTTDIRRKKLRALIDQSSVSTIAKKLGYRQPSFLSQMVGPNPTREVTEKSARRFEKELGLPSGYLDTPDEDKNHHEQDRGHTPAASGDTALIAEVIRMVGATCSGEGLALPQDKFADIVALAYVDAAEHGQQPRPEHIKQIVRLLK